VKRRNALFLERSWQSGCRVHTVFLLILYTEIKKVLLRGIRRITPLLIEGSSRSFLDIQGIFPR
jgi:hypothetical protein